MSGYLILIHLTAWIGLCVLVSVWLVCYTFIYREVMEGEHEAAFALDMFEFVELLIVLMKALFVILMLFMFIEFSRPHIFDQFDKVCKKKFLDHLDKIHSEDEEAQHAVKINLSRYLFRLEAQSRKETRNLTITSDTKDNSTTKVSSISLRSSGKIIDDTIITIFMSFLMYAPVGRRDFLRADMSIEEEF